MEKRQESEEISKRVVGKEIMWEKKARIRGKKGRVVGKKYCRKKR